MAQDVSPRRSKRKVTAKTYSSDEWATFDLASSHRNAPTTPVQPRRKKQYIKEEPPSSPIDIPQEKSFNPMKVPHPKGDTSEESLNEETSTIHVDVPRHLSVSPPHSLEINSNERRSEAEQAVKAAMAYLKKKFKCVNDAAKAYNLPYIEVLYALKGFQSNLNRNTYSSESSEEEFVYKKMRRRRMKESRSPPVPLSSDSDPDIPDAMRKKMRIYSRNVIRLGAGCRYEGDNYNRMLEAIEAFHTGKYGGIRSIAKKFGLPKSTLARWIKSNKTGYDRPPTLSKEAEIRLCNYVQYFGNVCFKVPSSDEMDKIIQSILEDQGGLPWFKKNVDPHASDYMKWSNIRRKYSDIYQFPRLTRNNETTNIITAVFTFFDNLQQLYGVYKEFTLNQIVIIDEYAFMNDHVEHVRPCLGSRDTKDKFSNSNFIASTVLAVQGNGAPLRPLIVMTTSEDLNQEMLIDGLEGACYGTRIPQQIGCDASTFKMYFEDVLVREVRKKVSEPERPVLMIFDAINPFIFYSIFDIAAQYNIIIFSLPLHSTKVLNPFAFGVNRSIENHYMQAAQMNQITTAQFPAVFKSIYNQTFSEVNTPWALENVGIYPLDRSKMSEVELTFIQMSLQKHNQKPAPIVSDEDYIYDEYDNDERRARRRTKKSERKVRSAQIMLEAYELFKRTGRTMQDVARAYNMPRSTLQDWVRRIEKEDLGTDINDVRINDEYKLINFLQYMANTIQPLSEKDVVALVRDLVPNNADRPAINQKWIKRFVIRNSEELKDFHIPVDNKKDSETLDAAKHFDAISALMHEYGITKPNQLYAVEEFAFGAKAVLKKKMVLNNEDTAVRMPMWSDDDILASAMFAASPMTSDSINPLVVFAMDPKIHQTSDVAFTVKRILFSKTRDITVDAEPIVTYFRDMLIPGILNNGKLDNEYVLVILENVDHLFLYSVFEIAQRYNIILYNLPPSGSRVLHPFRMGLDEQIAGYYTTRVPEFDFSPQNAHGIGPLLLVLVQAIQDYIIKDSSVIEQAFLKSGLWPFEHKMNINTNFKQRFPGRSNTVTETMTDSFSTAMASPRTLTLMSNPTFSEETDFPQRSPSKLQPNTLMSSNIDPHNLSNITPTVTNDLSSSDESQQRLDGVEYSNQQSQAAVEKIIQSLSQTQSNDILYNNDEEVVEIEYVY